MVKDASTKRQRSPDYPYYSLPECVKYIENLKKKEGLVKLPKKTALADRRKSHQRKASLPLSSQLQRGCGRVVEGQADAQRKAERAREAETREARRLGRALL